ncbi:MAG: phage terminase large subunit [Kofleriaceae bacterium]
MSDDLDLGDERELEASILRDSLFDFFVAGWHVHEPSTPLQLGPHVKVLCDAVQAVIEDWARRQRDSSFVQRVKNLLVCLPPGSLKSRILAYAVVAWAWLRWPTLRATCLSTNPRVALRDSVICRDLIASSWYQQMFRPTWQVRQDADAKGSFINTAGGFRNAMGFDARIIGERADLIVVDDPHDPEEALSDALRRSVLERWDLSIANRVNDLSCSIRIAIGHRAHDDDFAAARIREGGWCHLDLPVSFIADERCVTPIGSDWRTVDGESLHPERFTPEVIAKERERLGPLRFATLYMQRPAPAGGALVKLDSIRFWREPGTPDAARSRPRGCWDGPSVEYKGGGTVTIACDLNMGKATKAGDYAVVVAVAKLGSSFFILDVWRKRADFPDIQAAFESFANRWPNARKVVEAAAAGRSLETSLRSKVPGLIGVPPQGSKIQRVHAALPFFEAHNVHISEYRSDLGELLTELCSFPNARNDDFPDALVLALSQATVREVPESVPGHRCGEAPQTTYRERQAIGALSVLGGRGARTNTRGWR